MRVIFPQKVRLRKLVKNLLPLDYATTCTNTTTEGTCTFAIYTLIVTNNYNYNILLQTDDENVDKDTSSLHNSGRLSLSENLDEIPSSITTDTGDSSEEQ